jgi:hypothetical protein
MVIHRQASVLMLPELSPGINSDFSEMVEIKFNVEVGCKALEDCVQVEDLNLGPVTCNMQCESDVQLVNATQSTFVKFNLNLTSYMLLKLMLLRLTTPTPQIDLS